MTRGRVYLGMIAWEIESLIDVSCHALLTAVRRLAEAGFDCEVQVIDNASEDLTYTRASEILPGRVCSRREPESASRLRNYLVSAARAANHDYLLLLDGDIIVSPCSLLNLVESLESRFSLAAIAAEPTQCLMVGPSYEPPPVTSYTREALMYLCGLGVFRLPFLAGMSFEDQGPFRDPGWGCEDDDWYFQLLLRERAVAYIDTAPYQHPQRHSSWPALQRLGIDPRASFEERRAYLLTKWRAYSSLAPYLHLLEGVHV